MGSEMCIRDRITVADAKHIIQHLDEEKPEGVENESVEQIAFADRIMLNKIDLVSEEELEEVESKIKSINRFAPMYHTENSIIDPVNLINIGSFDLEKTLEMDPEFLDTEAEHEHDDRVTSTSSKFEGALNVNKLERWIGELMQTKARTCSDTRESWPSRVWIRNSSSRVCICCSEGASVPRYRLGRKVRLGSADSSS